MRQIYRRFEDKGTVKAGQILSKWLNYHRNYRVVSHDSTINSVSVVCEVMRDKHPHHHGHGNGNGHGNGGCNE